MFPHGTEPILGATLANAETNVAELIRDIVTDATLPAGRKLPESDIEIVRLPDHDAGGRFAFTLTVPTPDADDLVLTVLMPGLPLDLVNFGARVDDRPTFFPRLYLDGSSWLWRNAVTIAAAHVTVALRSRP